MKESKCPICGRVSPNDTALSQHMKRMHDTTLCQFRYDKEADGGLAALSIHGIIGVKDAPVNEEESPDCVINFCHICGTDLRIFGQTMNYCFSCGTDFKMIKMASKVSAIIGTNS